MKNKAIELVNSAVVGINLNSIATSLELMYHTLFWYQLLLNQQDWIQLERCCVIFWLLNSMGTAFFPCMKSRSSRRSLKNSKSIAGWDGFVSWRETSEWTRREEVEWWVHGVWGGTVSSYGKHRIFREVLFARVTSSRTRSRTLTATRCNSDADPLHRANDLRNALDTLNSGVRAGSWFAEYPRIRLHSQIGWLRFTSLKSRRADY